MSPATSPHVLQPHSWGRAPELYGPRHDYRESLMMRFVRESLPRGRVLNAGCGAGSFTMRLLDAGYSVTSVDASADFVEHVKALLSRRGGSDADAVELADLHDLRFDDGSFDGVVCGEVLEHLDDDVAAASELARVLRPRGVLVASVPANPWRFDWVDQWAGHHRRYTPESLTATLAQAGFAVIRITPYGFPITGLYHRLVYTPLLRRRLEAGNEGSPAPGGRLSRLAPLLRKAFEVDTLFLGRRPGYFGLFAVAHAPGRP